MASVLRLATALTPTETDMRIESQPAFVLHTRPFRDSSLLVEFICAEYGRVSGVVRGVRASGKTAKQRRSMIQPLVPLVISWSGNTDLKTIYRYEPAGAPAALQGERLFSVMYVNELYSRLLQHYDQNPQWYQLYQEVLQRLGGSAPVDVALRLFELQLLQELGYGIDLHIDSESERIRPDQAYTWDPEAGLVAIPDDVVELPKGAYSGADLLAVANGEFHDSARRAAKHLCRQLLAPHLGGRPLKSRDLFRRPD